MRHVQIRLLVVTLVMTGCTSAAADSFTRTTLPGSTTSSTVSSTLTLVPPVPRDSATAAPVGADPESTVSVLLAGDVMLGRGVASLVHDDPVGLFEDVRFVVAGADVAAANLESPLTLRPHLTARPVSLEADPAAVVSLATAGFDLVGIANNHAGDAGRLSILDTIDAVESAGMQTVGGGARIEDAYAVRVLERNGLKVGFVALDATGFGTPATADRPGIAHWDEARVRTAITSIRAEVDLLVAGVHGGVEYYRETDPAMEVLAGRLAEWGVDVVWGHGAHVIQPVYLTDGIGDRTTVVATSLGNLLFDQAAAGTRDGALLEVLADHRGVFAYRVGTAGHHDGRVRFDRWMLPDGDAALLDLEWWNLIRTPTLAPVGSGLLAESFAGGELVAASIGDATGDGREDVVISHRRPYQENEVNNQYPHRPWADAQGRSAHLGVYRPGDLRELWVAGSLFRPVAGVAVCDGALALAFDSLDDAAIVATGGWVWQGFGFTVPAELSGPGTPGCCDVDGDGRLDPVIVERS